MATDLVHRQRIVYIARMSGADMALPKRRKIRLEGYDYSSCGAYFVTICVVDKNALLWDAGADIIRPLPDAGADIIRPHKPKLSQYGRIVETSIVQISSHYKNVLVDKYCIMPDHVHMIVFIMPNDNGRMVSAHTVNDGRMLSAPTLSVIIGSMKRWVSKQIGFSIWQKSFNDRVIRNENSYREIWRYIDENSMKYCCMQGRISSARKKRPTKIRR